MGTVRDGKGAKEWGFEWIVWVSEMIEAIKTK